MTAMGHKRPTEKSARWVLGTNPRMTVVGFALGWSDVRTSPIVLRVFAPLTLTLSP